MMTVQDKLRTPRKRAGLCCIFAGIGGAFAVSPSVADQAVFDVYGQLNFGVISIDNGAGRDAYFAENPHSPSRIGATYATPLSGGGNLTFNIEAGFGLTGLDDVSPAEPSLKSDIDRKVLRKFEVIWKTPNSGTLSFGQGSMASDGASGADFSGTFLAQGPSISDLGGSTEFLNVDGTPSGIEVSDAYDDLTGLRRFRLRYDTSEWNGFTLSAAYGQEILRRNNNNDYYDVSIRYAKEWDDVQLETIVSYEWIDDIAERLVASASALHVPTGLNASIAVGLNQIGAGDYAYVKLGWLRDFWDVGSTAMSVEYYSGDDLAFPGSESRAYGIGVVQRLEALNTEVFATQRRYDLSGGTALQDVDLTAFGARWRF